MFFSRGTDLVEKSGIDTRGTDLVEKNCFSQGGQTLYKGDRPCFSEINENALTNRKTMQINGIFVGLVFISHFTNSYVPSFSLLDKPYLFIKALLGQLIVSTFLFYSGFGLGLNLKKNRIEYSKKIITKRFFSVFIKFAICVLLYHIYNYFVSKTIPSFSFLIKTLFGYESAGNSAWYIFFILASYVGLFLSFRFVNNKNVSLIILALFTLLYSILLMIIKPHATHYYNLSFLLFFGVVFAFYQKKIESLIKKNWFLVFIITLILFCVFYVALHFWDFPKFFDSFFGILFVFLIVLVTYKIEFDSKVLMILGKYIFYIYILQRLPMKFFSRFNISTSFLLLICILCTGLLSFVLDKLFKKMKL